MIGAAPLPKVFLGIWAVYPLLVPFYLMGRTPIPGTEKVEGGVPQLADYYLVGIMALVFVRLPFRLSRSLIPVVVAVMAFVGYTGFINMSWAMSLEDLSLLKSTLFYAYDALLFLTCLVLYASFQEAFLRVTFHAVAASVVLQAILSPLAVDSAQSRQALFFNNENQLGYFCVLAATIFVLGSQRFAVKLRYQAIFYAAVAYLGMLAQSRTSLLGLGTLLIVALVARPMRLMLALGGLVAVYILLNFTPTVLPKSEERLVVQGEYDTLATRGYDRIVNYPEHILFGAGEGAYERFRSELYASELHSSYGTVLFCYGIPGTCLFSLGLLFIVKQDARALLFLLPAFVHGTGHHGLRFAFFWAALAFLCCWAMPVATAASAEAGGPDVPPDESATLMQHPEID
jgi:hypothetical protein